MEGDGVSSGSGRSGGDARGERSSLSMQGFFTAQVGHESDGATPKCHCGVYAVLYLLKTTANSNRPFFGCSFFKVRLHHCKIFLWLDRHTAKFGRFGDVKGGKEDDDVNEHFGRMNIENRVANLEKKVAAIEKKNCLKRCGSMYGL
ncbi:hypothetical protein PIB30_014925 [Stylosanthes scabra]|uniref:GRF-type domain-containing protein n=1 Tax=Stylosanthes scabra TaxID=79078 RepID=A0ABU6V971_9FABA|nr:hypothetical protein [Stylosanthes scabra]